MTEHVARCPFCGRRVATLDGNKLTWGIHRRTTLFAENGPKGRAGWYTDDIDHPLFDRDVLNGPTPWARCEGGRHRLKIGAVVVQLRRARDEGKRSTIIDRSAAIL